MKKLIIAAGLACFSTVSTAGVVAQYEVSNYSGGSHGLWTNGSFENGKFFGIDEGSYFTVFENAGVLSGKLTGSATNSAIGTASFDIDLGGFAETPNGFNYKKEGGVSWDASKHNDAALADSANADIDFFTALEGTITFNFKADIEDATYNVTACCNTAFQFGLGANAKKANEFGGSAWLKHDFSEQDWQNSFHWDLNLKFDKVAAVSEPGTLALLGLGVAGLIMSRRRK